MRNAEASVDPPTDPFAAASSSAPPRKHPVRPASAKLPKGVSADIFGGGLTHPRPAQTGAGQGGLPPQVPPVEPWPLRGESPPREESPPPPPLTAERAPGGHTRRNALIVVFVVLLLLYLVPAMFMAGQVLPGTTVLGVDIGGQTAAQAVQTLRTRLRAQAGTPIVVREGTQRVTVAPQDAGLGFDAAATVRQAATGFPTPGEVWRALTGGRQIRPHVTVDEVRMSVAVSWIVARAFEKPAQEAGIDFRGLRPVVVGSQTGRKIDRAKVAEDIRRAYLSTDVMVDVATENVDPVVSDQEVRGTLVWAERAVSRPITLIGRTGAVEITREALAANLSFVPDGRVLRPQFDAARAIAGAEPRLVGPGALARDAAFTIRNGRVVLVASAPGRRVDTDRLAADVIEAMQNGSRTIRVSVINGPARLTDAAATGMGIKTRVGRFTTTYACCLPRVANIKTIAGRVNGYLVRPGETFSLNRVVGRRDASTGFVGDAVPTLIAGRSGSDVAGVSQFATAMLNAVLRAGLTDIEHTPHEVHVPEHPAGLEAAVSYPSPDLRWRNDSPYAVLVQAEATDTALSVSLWSTKRYDVVISAPVRSAVVRLPPKRGSGADCVPARGQPGFTVEITRELKDRGSVVESRTFTTTYKPRAEVTCPGG